MMCFRFAWHLRSFLSIFRLGHVYASKLYAGSDDVLDEVFYDLVALPASVAIDEELEVWMCVSELK